MATTTTPPTSSSPAASPTAASGRRSRGAPGRPPGIRFERPHWEAGRIVAGIDEVGRGAWAGPVTFGAVILEPDRKVQGLRDSKVLTPERRQRVARRLHQVAVGVGIGHASNEEIDRLGMSAAMRLAARRAVSALPIAPEVLLIDGNWDLLADLGTRNETIVRGDSRSASIAAASIVAKVTRDGLLVDADPDHPVYGFASNKGYPAPAHLEALDLHGPCRLHRASWAPIAALLQPRLFDAG
jgi:ribonuclease HII